MPFLSVLVLWRLEWMIDYIISFTGPCFRLDEACRAHTIHSPALTQPFDEVFDPSEQELTSLLTAIGTADSFQRHIMSDNERGAAGDDVGLPRATVNKLISEILPEDVICSKDTKDLVAECCKEFITLISSEANEICEKEAKKTISPEHITSALKQLGFDDFIEEVEDINRVHKAQAKKENQKRKNKLDQSAFTQDELAAQQELLFAASKARFDAGQS
ncbi:hypothetical protein MJO28_010977 [Puccinia striiformis f. sp. tritici]|uniref:Transcription factor CBF/NF-Y/archaeal histone domain-containing protein n=2 Tax=Puccinia striiformis TaxID=27350 RepID=A0A2S4VAV3_9BASI|nr:hypothetical protein Pst134EA_019792 [Puccinia striiformis f. sp. tritici]KAH9459651.1 hypothetical protein Pst134EA_019792 [Puccinia striiformis f. sp. tritici]KAI7945282.1 hypothetical protein MJO28_010977 [Puccinia striiformis f. sp. tritici]KAI7949051.1 hypothetical protein MJO29_010716 [Puccinia striiformis f. sp. tritici]POW06647.1 hypothetical protein PSTT_08836 [Puccinia striiformis]